jgi:hypothetical protein
VITQAWQSHNKSVRWRLTPKGIEVKGFGVQRTGGAPATARRIYQENKAALIASSHKYNIPIELIIACIATESSGKASAIRFEPGYISDEKTPNKVSPGIMQTLISTARSATGNKAIDRDYLLNAANSIDAGTAYIDQQRKVTGLDPVLVAAAYNAGGIYDNNGAKNRWKLRMYPIGTGEHCDRFVKWFNDVFAVFAQDGAPSGCMSLYAEYNGTAPVSRTAVAAQLIDQKDVIAVKAAASSFWSKAQIGFAALFGVPAAGSALFDSVNGVVAKTQSFLTTTMHLPGGVVTLFSAGIAIDCSCRLHEPAWRVQSAR